MHVESHLRRVMTKRHLLETLQMRPGHQIEQVWYTEHRYPGGKPGWNLNSRFDSIDHYITFVTERGVESIGFWGGEAGRFGLRMMPGMPVLPRVRRWKVSGEPKWQGLIGRPIRGFTHYWSWFELGSERLAFPESAVLDFGRGAKVYLTVRDASADEEDRPVVEQLSVFFDVRDARRYQVGPFAGLSQRLVGERHFPVRPRVPWAEAPSVPPALKPFGSYTSLQSLIGQRLEQVWYLDRRLPGDGADCWSHNPLLDTPAHGVVLITPGELFYLTAAQEGEAAGIGVGRTVPPGKGPTMLVEATTGSRWKEYIGRTIRDVQVHWGWRQQGRVSLAYPLQLELIFAPGGRVFLSPLTCPGDPAVGQAYLAVCFDAATARRYGVGIRR